MAFGKNDVKKISKKVLENHHPNDFLMKSTSQYNVVEAFRNLKAALSVSIPKTDKGGVSIMVTSAYPEEGKTTVSVNLALMFAMSSKAKVVVVDTDIRKGRIAKFFKGKRIPGLSEYLSGQLSLDEIIKKSDAEKTFDYITCGTHSPRPYEMLESQAMKNLDKELRERYDYIIYDTSPMLLVSDALAVATVTDGTVVVTRHLRSYMSDLGRVLSTLKFAKINVLGVVLNDYQRDVKKVLGYKRYYNNEYYAYGKTSDKGESEKEKIE